MVKKIKDENGQPAKGKQLQQKRLKLKSLHRKMGESRADLSGLAPDQLPPASSSNAARQVRSRLNISFPVNWQELHAKKQTADDEGPGDS